MSCADVGGAQACVAPCADGACADGYVCDADVCKPPSGMCDACGGICQGATPVCVAAAGECGECGPGFPCAEGMVCNAQNRCEEAAVGACVQDLDCRGRERPVCFGGNCVPCLQDVDCGPRARCDANMDCIADNCAGVACQLGSECNGETGRCDPGCNADGDCAAPEMVCNMGTGQCWYRDALFMGCDVGGGDGVCAPGSTCDPSALSPRPGGGICSCVKEDPLDPMSADLIPCHPGGTCLHGEFPPGSGMVPPTGICLAL